MPGDAGGSKKKLAQLRRAGAGASYADLCDPAHALREGHDFADQQQLAEAQMTMGRPAAGCDASATCGAVQGHAPATCGLTTAASAHLPSRGSGFQPESAEHGLTCGAVMRLVQMTLRDLQMHQRTGQLPGGMPYSRLPAWQVELYRAWWQESQAW